MNIKTKKRLTYITIAIFNLLTGIEYAVVFPTLWSYIHERYNASSYMLGIVISAFSFAGLFSNPLVGCWADRTQNVKLIILVTNLGEITGSFMYFLGLSAWFLAVSRLVAGLGVGGGAALLADITRSTSEEERTSILSIVISCRQIGLLIGPALNLFLRELHTTIGPFPLDKFTSPGLFMTLMWTIMEVAFLLMYRSLASLKAEEQLEQLVCDYDDKNSISSQEPHKSDVDFENTFTNPQCSTPVLDPEYPDIRHLNSQLPPSASAPSLLIGNGDSNEEQNKMKKELSFSQMPPSGLQIIYDDPFAADGDMNCPGVTFMQSDNTPDYMIETAEHYIASTSDSHLNGPSSASSKLLKEKSRNSHAGYAKEETYHQLNRDDSFHSVILSDDSACDNAGLTSTWRELYSEYVRDEVIVLLALSFTSAFCQTTLETVVTPLAQKLFGFNELENSFIYLAAGIEIILVFVGIHFASKKLSDRFLLLGALIIMCAALGWTLHYVPSSAPGDMKKLPYIAVGLFLDLLSVPVLIVCSASLLSKVTSQATQAFSQGLRRSLLSLGCIFGPLWGGGALHRLYVEFAVPLALCILITLLFLGSYRQLGQKNKKISTNVERFSDHPEVDISPDKKLLHEFE